MKRRWKKPASNDYKTKSIERKRKSSMIGLNLLRISLASCDFSIISLLFTFHNDFYRFEKRKSLHLNRSPFDYFECNYMNTMQFTAQIQHYCWFSTWDQMHHILYYVRFHCLPFPTNKIKRSTKTETGIKRRKLTAICARLLNIFKSEYVYFINWMPSIAFKSKTFLLNPMCIVFTCPEHAIKNIANLQHLKFSFQYLV